MTTHHEPWQHIANHDNTSRTMTTHHEPWRRITNHDDTSQTMTTHHEPWWHITNHDETSRTTMKHHKPPRNHHKLPRITTNHYKSYCKVLNIIEVAVYVNCPRKYVTNFRNTRDPTRWFNHDDFQWTMTLNHDMTQKELCIKPYGFLVDWLLNRTHTVFSRFRVSLFALNQSLSLVRSSSTDHLRYLKFLWLCSRVVSSANRRLIPCSTALCRSLMNTRNNKGPRQEPWACHMILVDMWSM